MSESNSKTITISSSPSNTLLYAITNGSVNTTIFVEGIPINPGLTQEVYISASDVPLLSTIKNISLVPVATNNGSGTGLTLSGMVEANLALDPTKFVITNGTLTLNSNIGTGGSSGSISVNGTAVSSFDSNSFNINNGTIYLNSTAFGSLSNASTLNAATQILVVSSGTAYSTNLQALATEIAVLNAATMPTIAISNIAAQSVGQSFTISGALVNYSSAPTLSFADNSNSFTVISGGTISTTAFSFTHPAFSSTGSNTVSIKDQNGINSTSNTFAVNYATATAAVISNSSTVDIVGSAITSATATLTPSYAQAYTCLNIGGADQGTRTAFTGSSIPALTPTATGTYTINIYAASTGGTALATSSNITVSSVSATAATLANVPSTATGGTAITGVTATLTPNGSTAYAILNNGADQGSRIGFSGTSVPNLTPTIGNAGTYTIKIYAASTGGTALATSSNIVVTDIATAATLSNVPSTANTGVAITGVTDTITPSDAVAYACLFNGSSQEGSRYSFTGTSVPSLTPAATGTYTINIYAASTGGTALATSSNITVSAIATAATISGAPTATIVGAAINASDTLTPSGATAYACLNNGSDLLPRTVFSGTSLPTLTASSIGTYTIKIYAAATGGVALATSSNIVVSAANSVPTIASGVAPALVLDASQASSVYADSGLTTTQTTNGGTVQGWKDTSGNGYNFSGASGGAVTLVTNSQNGLNGISFAAAGNPGVYLNSNFAAQIGALFSSATQPVTIALVCEYADTSAGSFIQFADSGYSNQVFSGGYATSWHGIGNSPPVATLVPGTLNIVIMTYNPQTLASSVWINNAAVASNTDAHNYNGVTFAHASIGNIHGGTNTTANIIYEMEIWPGLASGVGGTSPTGDIATLINYYTTKWG